MASVPWCSSHGCCCVPFSHEGALSPSYQGEVHREVWGTVQQLKWAISSIFSFEYRSWHWFHWSVGNWTTGCVWPLQWSNKQPSRRFELCTETPARLERGTSGLCGFSPQSPTKLLHDGHCLAEIHVHTSPFTLCVYTLNLYCHSFKSSNNYNG